MKVLAATASLILALAVLYLWSVSSELSTLALRVLAAAPVADDLRISLLRSIQRLSIPAIVVAATAVILAGATVGKGSPNRLGAIALLVSLAALVLTVTLLGA